jgi:AcrR family transcriptional regulator
MHYTARQLEIMEAATERIDKYGIQNLTIKTLAADIGLSEPALYRHFNSKNDILLSILDYFISEIKKRSTKISFKPGKSALEELTAIVTVQLKLLANRPAIASVVFAESIFHFDEQLTKKIKEIVELMHKLVGENLQRGQQSGQYSKICTASVLTTLLLGGIRMTVLKWKLADHKSNLLKDGLAVLDGLTKMIVIK